jgi:hypothetical protein
MRMRFILTLLVALAALAAPVRATVVVAADLGELAREARAIVRGRVQSVDGRWTDDRRTIETIVTLEVASYLKGALGPTVQFRVPGGDLGRYRSIVVGAPLFAVNEEVVVFLGASGPAVPYILGFNQGVYRVVRAADNSGPVVTPPALLPSVAGTTPVVRGDPSRRPLPLAGFEERVRALAGGSK